MVFVKVLNAEGIMGWGGTFPTQAEADAWVAQETANGSWGPAGSYTITYAFEEPAGTGFWDRLKQAWFP